VYGCNSGENSASILENKQHHFWEENDQYSRLSSNDWLKVSIVPLIFNNDSWPAQFYKLIRQDVKCNWMVATSLVSPNMDTAGGKTICTTDKAHVAKFPLRKDDIESYS
jgi:hypothetical protein